MLKIIFQIIAILGIVIISILAFVLPNDPYMIIPAMSVMSFDKPLWFAIIVSCSFVYICILYSIYDYLSERCCYSER